MYLLQKSTRPRMPGGQKLQPVAYCHKHCTVPKACGNHVLSHLRVYSIRCSGCYKGVDENYGNGHRLTSRAQTLLFLFRLQIKVFYNFLALIWSYTKDVILGTS